MNWKYLEAKYPYCYDVFKKYLEDLNCDVDVENKSEVNPIFKRFLKNEGYSDLFIENLKQYELSLRAKDEPRLKNLPLKIQKRHLINHVNDLVVGKDYKVRKGGENGQFVVAKYEGEKDKLYCFKNSFGIRLIKKHQLLIRVFKNIKNSNYHGKGW